LRRSIPPLQGFVFLNKDPDKPVQQTDHVTAVSRVIFEFPLWSGRFFDFYNTHATTNSAWWPVNWYVGDGSGGIFPWLLERHGSLKADLIKYYLPQFEYKNSLGLAKREQVLTYPPIFAGDFNRTFELSPRDHFSEVFWNSPAQTIDKVLVGDHLLWEGDDLGFSKPIDEKTTDFEEDPDDACTVKFFPFICADYGYYVGFRTEGDINPYSDHSPGMVTIRAKDIGE